MSNGINWDELEVRFLDKSKFQVESCIKKIHIKPLYESFIGMCHNFYPYSDFPCHHTIANKYTS